MPFYHTLKRILIKRDRYGNHNINSAPLMAIMHFHFPKCLFEISKRKVIVSTAPKRRTPLLSVCIFTFVDF